MNTKYNTDRARNLLRTLYTDSRCPEAEATTPLRMLKLSETRVKSIKQPPSLRLVTSSEEDNVEVSVTLQGVLCGRLLPPLTHKPVSRSLSSLRNLRQHVKLTGLGVPEFDDACRKIGDAVAMFKSHVPHHGIPDVEFTAYEGDASVEAHARYWTDRKLIPRERNNPFQANVDAFGVLAAIQPDVFIHGPDNVVEYCRIDAGVGASATRHVAFNPSLFRVGDIVEIAFSFVGVPVKEGGYRVMLNLRALTLIDSEIRTESERAVVKRESDCTLTRKRLYLADDAVVSISKKPRVEETKQWDVDANAGSVRKEDEYLPVRMHVDE